MKNFLKFTVLLISFFSITFEVFSHQIGVLETEENFNCPVLSIKTPNNKLLKIPQNSLSTLNPQNTPLLIFCQYTNISDNTYNNIVKYIKNGGKIILITPNTQNEEKIFKKLCKLIGVNVEKIKSSNEKIEINWVERTLDGNNLKQNSPIVYATLYPETSHLAVFGDIERHETAISLNSKGSMIAWKWGIDGEKKFNEKSMQFLFEELLPQAKSKSPFLHPLFNYEEDIEKLKNSRSYIENYQDNIINYSQDISSAQQNLELSKINELLASYYFKNNNFQSYTKYIKTAQDNVFEGTYGTNNLASAENRGIWFDRGTVVSIKNQNEMAQYFEKLKKSGINTVYLETVNAGYAIYPTKIGVQNPLTIGRDPLAWAVEEAHARKIKIHAWIWIFAVGNDRHNKLLKQKDDYVGPILERNMRWALLGEYGNFRPKSQPEFWIDPSNKEGVNYLINLANEIVKNYNVDGIQLDYIRYPFQRNDNLMGFNHNSTEQFAIKTGEKLFENNYQTNFLWNKWKENNINDFVKKLSVSTKRIKPSLKISASIFSKSQPNRLNSIQQNWENWIMNSYIDTLTPMSYSTSLESLNTNLFYLRPQIGACLIYPGIALKHVDEISMLKQIAAIREEGFSGISFFAMAQLDNEKANYMNYGVYSQNALDPTYNTPKAAVAILEDYKIMLQTIKQTNSDLKAEQKNLIDDMISTTNTAIFRANSAQLNRSIETINDLIKQNDIFFKTFSKYNDQRKQTAISYLKRASNLLKISARK